MIIIGIDPHPATFTAAVLDASSAGVFGTLEVDNSEVGPPTAPKVGPPNTPRRRSSYSRLQRR